MTYLAELGSLALSGVLLGATLYGPSGCDEGIDCQAKQCAPTYELELESVDPTLAEGAWHLALEVDGLAIEADCVVSGPEDSICEVGAWGTTPDRSLTVEVSVRQRTDPGSGEPTDTGDVPQLGNQAIFVTISAGDEMPPVAVLDVTAQHEDTILVETERTPAYDIDEAFGGEGCGSCPRPFSETLALP